MRRVPTPRRRPRPRRDRAHVQLLPRRRRRRDPPPAAARLPRRARRGADPARRRGARLPRRARLGDPVHLRAAADGRRARPRRPRRSSAASSKSSASRTRCSAGTSCRRTPAPSASNRRPTPRRDRGAGCRSSSGSRAAAARSPSAASRSRCSAATHVRHPSRGGATAFRDGPGVGCCVVSVVTRNALLLAGGLVFQSGMIQLAVALGTVTIVTVTGVESILGLGPAVFLLAGAAAVGPAGRISDRFGRMPVIRSGFVLGIARAVDDRRGLRARLRRRSSSPGSRSAAPPSRSSCSRAPPPPRCSGPSGAPAACRSSSSASSPARSGARSSSGRCSPGRTMNAARPRRAVARRRRSSRSSGSRSSFGVRPDPKVLSQAYADDGVPESAAPVRELLDAARASRPRWSAPSPSFAVMVGVMNLAGYVAVGHHHASGRRLHRSSARTSSACTGSCSWSATSSSGVGRRRSIVVGLARDGALEPRARLAGRRSLGMSLSLFGLGLGWNFSYVAATTELVDLAAALRARAARRAHRPALERHRRGARARRRRRLLRGRLDRPRARRDGARGRAGARGRRGALRASARDRGRPDRCYTPPPADARGPPSPRMKTYTAKPGEIARDWYLVDAEGKTLGRLATADRRRAPRQAQAAVHAARRHRRLRRRRQRARRSPSRARSSTTRCTTATRATPAGSRRGRSATSWSASRPRCCARRSGACCRRTGSPGSSC